MMKLSAKPVVNLNRKCKALMIEAFLQDALGYYPKGLRLLDIGCGNGDIYAHYSKNNFAVGVDIYTQRRSIYQLLPYCLAQSENLPFSNSSFDVVISHHVIEHVNDQNMHLSEIHRILSRNGICYLGTPNKSSPFMRGHLNNSMVLHYNQMKSLFERNGFLAEETYTRFLHQPHHYQCEVKFGRFIPVSVLYTMRRWFPSQCFILRPYK